MDQPTPYVIRTAFSYPTATISASTGRSDRHSGALLAHPERRSGRLVFCWVLGVGCWVLGVGSRNARKCRVPWQGITQHSTPRTQHPHHFTLRPPPATARGTPPAA